VIYGASVYVCSTAHTASAAFATDLATKWTKLIGGVRYRGAWVSGTPYLKDDLVTSGSSSYLAKNDVTSATTPSADAANWDIAMAGSDTSVAKSGDTVTGNLTIAASLIVQTVLEKLLVKASAPASPEVVDLKTQGTVYSTVAATAAWAFNFRGDSTTPLDSMLTVGQSISFTYIATMGATGYVPNAYQIDGVAITPKWIGATAPTANNNCMDVYSFTIIKTAAATFTLLASRSKAA
jgi:hypothetical protein